MNTCDHSSNQPPRSKTTRSKTPARRRKPRETEPAPVTSRSPGSDEPSESTARRAAEGQVLRDLLADESGSLGAVLGRMAEGEGFASSALRGVAGDLDVLGAVLAGEAPLDAAAMLGAVRRIGRRAEVAAELVARLEAVGGAR